MAENQIKAWQEKGGENSLQNKGKKLQSDQHMHVANALGVGHDYVHSKILADNNIKPESIQRRIDLDRNWQTLRGELQNAYHAANQKRTQLSPAKFSHSQLARVMFETRMQELDEKAQKVNQAIISDSLRFNGRSPVPQSRRFRLQERILEALEEEGLKT
eukprot:scaffold9895_cov156-Amphora_coffeaeformis.AAC.1